LKPSYASSAIDHLLGEKNGSDLGMRLNFVVKNAKLTQKKIKQILELNGFNTILISKGINNYG
jgi:hypothetical protein|tara:strand:- start:349 stop:537 length:189 start_codon:yes stop_codon:yes gene_type:complete